MYERIIDVQPEWWTRLNPAKYFSSPIRMYPGTERNGYEFARLARSYRQTTKIQYKTQLKVVQISKRSCREGWCHNTEGILRPVGDLQHDAIAGINYVLPKFMHYDSWNVRASQKLGSPVVRVIRAGEPFLVTKRVRRGGEEWLKVDRGWAKNLNGILRPVVGGETLFAPLEVSSSSPTRRSERLRKQLRDDSAPELPPPPLKKFKSMTARRAFEAVTELKKCRETLQRLQEMCARANNARDRATRNRLHSVFRAKRGKEHMVELSQRIERLNAELELCGSSREEVEATLSPRESDTGDDGVGDKFTFTEEDAMKAPPLVRMKSLMHADFANPRAQSCWLSTTFQALWHSRCFRKAYQELVEPLREYPPNTVTGAFQRTWRSYKERKIIDEKKHRRASRVGISPVHLTEVWGNQYGKFYTTCLRVSHL